SFSKQNDYSDRPRTEHPAGKYRPRLVPKANPREWSRMSRTDVGPIRTRRRQAESQVAAELAQTFRLLTVPYAHSGKNGLRECPNGCSRRRRLRMLLIPHRCKGSRLPEKRIHKNRPQRSYVAVQRFLHLRDPMPRQSGPRREFAVECVGSNGADAQGCFPDRDTK